MQFDLILTKLIHQQRIYLRIEIRTQRYWGLGINHKFGGVDTIKLIAEPIDATKSR